MVGLIILLAGLDYAGPVRADRWPPVPAVGSVLLRSEYLLIGKDGRPVRVGVDEWSEKRK